MNKPIKALIYCRVSSKGQEDALGSQEHRCREYARQKGYTVEAIFPDSYTGKGNFMHRPAMVELLEYLDAHRKEKYIVVFDDLKRFARDTVFHWNLRHALSERAATVECLNFKFEDTPEGTFIETVIAAQGQLEREQNRRQTLQKTKARLELGYWPFYPPPGYKTERTKLHGKLLVPKESEAPLIKEALDGFAEFRLQQQVDVQRFLEERRFQGKDRLHWEQVRKLLERVIYAGYIEYPPWGVTRRKGHHQALISLETFEKIQERLRASTISYKRRDIREDFPLRGLVQCSYCGNLLTASWSKGRSRRYPYYHCEENRCRAYGKSIRAEDLERDFLSLLKGIQPRPSSISLAERVCLDAWSKRTRSLNSFQDILATELEQVDRRFKGLENRLATTESDIAAQAYERKLVELHNRKLLLQEKLENGRSEERDFGTAWRAVASLLENPYGAWMDGDLARRRLVYKLSYNSPLPYTRNVGFGTGKLSYGLRLFSRFDFPTLANVQISEEDWNQIQEFVWSAYKDIQKSDQS
jgi:site-specific DNA recombinase